MFSTFTYLLLSNLFFTSSALSARGGTLDDSEEWGYIPVRPGASMFYWFYRTTHPDGYKNRPIVLWLQGGPGLSGTGLGNFLMFGPLDKNLEPRNSTWIQTANILFVDSPVDVGFGIVENSTEVSDTIEETTTDLISMLQVFMGEHPCFQSQPFYIFGQSYGGKVAAALTYYLHKAIQNGHIRLNLKGAGIGNGYVSGPDFLVSRAPMAYQMSLIDDVVFEKCNTLAWKAYEAAENGNWTGVKHHRFELWGSLAVPSSVNLYNIGEMDGGPWSIYDYHPELTNLMNGPIKEKLKIIPGDKEWYRSTNDHPDRDMPVWHLVDEVLKSSDIDIVVYSGQLDLMCNTDGALRWINKLTWDGLEKFRGAERKELKNPDTETLEMLVKTHGHLKFYWVLKAGHVVPYDVPDVALRMLNRILDGTD